MKVFNKFGCVVCNSNPVRHTLLVLYVIQRPSCAKEERKGPAKQLKQKIENRGTQILNGAI